MYEKIKIEQAQGAGAAEGKCSICDRPKGRVYCNNCSNCVLNVRARKPCPIHPKEMFLMDVFRCTKCKSENLLEAGLDDIPEHILAPLVLQSPSFSPGASVLPSGSLPTTQSTFPVPITPPYSPYGTIREPASQNSPMQIQAPSSNPGYAQASPTGVSGSRGLARGKKRPRVHLPPNFHPRSPIQEESRSPLANRQPQMMMQPSAAPLAPIGNIPQGPCNCNRLVEYVMCTNCGFYQEGAKKYIPCPVHVEAKTSGIKYCPNCGVPGDQLDEN